VEKQIINKMTPETIAMMFAMRPVMGRPFDKSKWTLFFKNDLHLKMENADTEKDFAYLNELAGEGYLDVMKYHYAGVTPCLDMSFFAKWVVEYENAKRAMRTREIVEVLREEKYDLYLKWSDLNDENKKLKEENAVLRKSTEVYEDVMAGSNGMIQTVADLKERIETANDDYGKMRQNMRAVLNMIEYTIGGGSDMSMKIHDILWSGADTTFESDSD
tara:strand:+ start:194 stop:844 length:651 start_codon:yes stop_codon:yes gene_type:complete